MTRASRLLASVSFLTLLLTPALGCTSSDDGEDDAADDEATESEDDGESSTDDDVGDDTTDGESTTGVEPLATASGQALDDASTALPTPFFQRCGPIVDDIAQSCISFQADAEGLFTVDFPQTGVWGLKFLDSSGGTHTGNYFTVEVAEGDALELEKVVRVPIADVLTTLPESGATDVAIEGGLTVTIDASTAQKTDFSAPTEAGGRQLSSDDWMFADTPAGPVVGMWTFYPAGVKAKEGAFEFSVDSSLDLAPGTPVAVYEMEKNNIVLLPVAEGTVNAEGTGLDLSTVGEGLHELSMLVVADAS